MRWWLELELCYLFCLTVVTPQLLRGTFGSVTGPFIVMQNLSCSSREDISKGNFSSILKKIILRNFLNCRELILFPNLNLYPCVPFGLIFSKNAFLDSKCSLYLLTFNW